MPEDNILNTGSEVKSFIVNNLNQIKEAVKECDFQIERAVDFDLEVTEKKEGSAEGGFERGENTL